MTPGSFLGLVLRAWLLALAALVAYRMLTGRIRLAGLLSADGDRFSPERLQMLLMTLGTLGAFAESALSQGRLPVLPGGLVGTLGASHLVYLGGKLWRRFANARRG